MNTFLQKTEVVFGDLTRLPVDAIVNAANSSLMGGGGVDGAIHKAGGPAILEECKKIIAKQGRCRTGEAVITTAGKLPARKVIHTVGPVWLGGENNEAVQLADCYKNSLRLAVENNCYTIAFPNISTGAYGFPKDQAAAISLQAVFEFITPGTDIEKVLFVCFDDENYILLKEYRAQFL